MMKSFLCYVRRLFVALAAGASIFMIGMSVAHAETYVTDGYLDGDIVWNESGSPYFIQDPVTIPRGSSLTIEPGAYVLGTRNIDGYRLIDVDGGHLSIEGSPEKRITLTGVGGIITEHGASTSIEYADITNFDGLKTFDSHLDVSSSTVSGIAEAVHIASSNVSIRNSRIMNNLKGIFIEPSSQPILQPLSSIGDLSVGGQSSPQASVHIVGSDITDNQEAAIENQDASVVDATHDWWGSDAGPSLDGSNRLVGSVEYDPWQTHASTSTSVCCSSILFIPGLEASRIYDAPHSILGTTTIQAWEPLSNPSTKTLYLNPDGTSISKNMYSGDPIGKAYGLYDIYGTFMKSLDGLMADGSISSWKAFGYDWRKPIAEVVAGPERKATITESLIDEVMAMASSSKTGKVTLIAHSNGGLVAKYLVKTLSDMGKAGLIDKVVSVAVPYLGTPLAIPSLLYGDGTSFGYGLLLKQSVAQKLGANMASAYSLLPSATYFAQNLGPTIAYASGSSSPVTTASAQDSLISSKLNGTLMAAAESLHAILDPFEWPAAIQRWALVGYGNDTVKSMVYFKSDSDKHIASTTLMGDSTVIAESAAYNSGTTTALDLPAISKNESKQFNHQNILSASTTQAVIKDILEGHAESLGAMPGVSLGLPANINTVPRIVVSTHSPVDLHVYDQSGNHTGVISAPSGSGVTDDVVTFYEANIPGSSFGQNGGNGTGDDTDTQISLPADTGQTYSVSIQGNGVGEFTYEVQRFLGDTLQSDTIYPGLPTTPVTVASTTIDTNTAASSSAPLIIDINGDGTTDIVAKSGANLDPMDFFEALKKVIGFLQLKRGNDLIGHVNAIEALFKRGKIKNVTNKLQKLEAHLGHKKFKSLTDNDRNHISDMIDQFVSSFNR